MYNIVWIRCKDKFQDVTNFSTLREAKRVIATALGKDVTDLRFTEIDYMEGANEVVVDYYGLIVACIIKGCVNMSL